MSISEASNGVFDAEDGNFEIYNSGMYEWQHHPDLILCGSQETPRRTTVSNRNVATIDENEASRFDR